MPAPASPPHDEDEGRDPATAAITASLAAIEGRPTDDDRPARRAAAVIHAIQAHRRPGSGTA